MNENEFKTELKRYIAKLFNVPFSVLYEPEKNYRSADRERKNIKKVRKAQHKAKIK